MALESGQHSLNTPKGFGMTKYIKEIFLKVYLIAEAVLVVGNHH